MEVEDKEERVDVKSREVLVAVVLGNCRELAGFLNLAWDWVLGVCSILIPNHGAVLVGCLEEIKDRPVFRIVLIVPQVDTVAVDDFHFLELAFH